MTLKTLQELIRDPEHQALPAVLARPPGSMDPWWKTMEILPQEAAKATIWEATQIIALLFNVYGENIKSVELTVDYHQDKNDAYMTSTVFINNAHCCNDDIELGQEVLDAVEKIDGSQTLKWAVVELDELGNSYLLPALNILEKNLNREFTSAEQDREIGLNISPEIESWARRQLLTRQAQDSIEQAPKMVR